MPVFRQAGELTRSGSLNACNSFEMRAYAPASESTYAGIIRMVSAAQAAKSPFIRMADRYALLLLPITLFVAGGAWLFSNDPVRALAVLVAATPCPLILAAPVVFIAGIAQAAKRGILIKGSGPLEALARAHTVMFDKTGTLTVGGARLVAIEAAPGHSTNEILQIAGSLEQASHHVVAAAIVEAAAAKGLKLSLPSKVREAMGSGRRHARRTIDTRGFASNGVRAAQAGSVGGARAAARSVGIERIRCRRRPANRRDHAGG